MQKYKDSNEEASTSSRVVGWHSSLTSCSTPATTADWAYACCCPFCAAAAAKSRMDQSACCVNLCCFSLCLPGTYEFVRVAYDIEGTGSRDVAVGCLLPCCAVRQMMTESRVRGELGGRYGSNGFDWHDNMGEFNDCTEAALSCCLPCLVAHRIHARLQLRSRQRVSQWVGMCCICPCSMYGQVRHTYGIRATCPFEDCCCGGCLYPCGLNRALKEVLRQEVSQRTTADVVGVAAGPTQLGLAAVSEATDIGAVTLEQKQMM